MQMYSLETHPPDPRTEGSPKQKSTPGTKDEKHSFWCWTEFRVRKSDFLN